MMNRRTLLQSLAALPFVRHAKPGPADTVGYSRSLPAGLLCGNSADMRAMTCATGKGVADYHPVGKW